MIGVINYGSGNIHAIYNVLKRLKVETKIINNASDFSEDISKVVLPGVGAFDEVIKNLSSSGLLPIITEKVLEKKMPTLGICVGMQLMGTCSEEGTLPGLNWIPGKIKKFDIKKINSLPKIPHMGWNSIEPYTNNQLFKNIDCEKGFYFIHSFYYSVESKENQIAATTYGENFSSVIKKDNIIGCQFHPEKSHSNGIQLFRNFLEI